MRPVAPTIGSPEDAKKGAHARPAVFHSALAATMRERVANEQRFGWYGVSSEARQVHVAHRDYYLRPAEEALAARQSELQEQWLAPLAAEDGIMKDVPACGFRLTPT